VAPTTDQLAQIRLMAVDTAVGKYLLTDEEYSTLFALEGDNVRLAAAAALELMATSHVLLAKKITTQDLTIDGPAVADALRKSAALLRGLVQKAADDADDDLLDGDAFGFDYVDFDPNRAISARYGWS
jgi:hypothetical protein